MWKLFILTYAALNIEGGPIGEIGYPMEFQDQETCEAVKNLGWQVRTNQNLIVHDAVCRQISEGV